MKAKVNEATYTAKDREIEDIPRYLSTKDRIE